MALPPSTLNVSGRSSRVNTAEAVLAALVVAVVGLMVVPLPTWLLDLLLAANLTGAVAILLVSLYVSDALKIAAFPSLLLITTLFRLALNVSSTRLILLQANAGEVIQAFGQFVVRGNYVVGAVIFLILTIIQFIVIAKGGERVAEVGARFALDAMPGKQLAIDAELRAGSIDANEARARRRALSREGQFYGAMDGAMKFVKGDVIASLLIAIVNITGGLAIGMSQRDLTLVAALKRYGLLTIGDGLVSQIPALVISTAAAVLVTRVASEEAETPLGSELASQLLGQPQALRVAGAFSLVLGLVPGLPLLPFVAIGAALFIAGAPGSDRKAQSRKRLLALKMRDKAAHEPEFLPALVPWGLELGLGFSTFAAGTEHSSEPRLDGVVNGVREHVFHDYGVALPMPEIKLSGALEPRGVVVFIHEIPELRFSIPESVRPEESGNFLNQQLRAVLERRLADFVGIAETQRLLDELETLAAPVVRQVVPKPLSVPLLSEVLRKLVEERVSIRDLRAILEALADASDTERDAATLAELVRSQLRRAITFQLSGGARELRVVVLDDNIEETVRTAIVKTPTGSFLTLSPAAGKDVVAAIKRSLAAVPDQVGPYVILTQPDIRRFVRKLLETELPALRVVSFAELLPEVAVRPVSRATVTGLG